MSANRLMDKLKCWKKHSKVELKSRYRTVLNNVCLDFNPDTEQPAQIKYKPNSIKTTKYSIWTFLPKNLFEQFHRLANVYFLFIALLNFIPRVNAFGKEIALIPVIAVLTVTGIKDAVEDYRRYRQDVKVNSALTLVYDKSKGDYIEIEWNRVRVGDIVKVKCNEVIPADLLLLSCSEGLSTCFIETANLDGESNLKQRTVVSMEEVDLKPTTSMRVECELPNPELYKFNGNIHIADVNRKAGLSQNNLLLRGCILRNTDHVTGIVIYAGHDTKAMMNTSGPQYKRSSIERRMNIDIIFCLVILIFLCFFSATGSGVWLAKWNKPEDIPYIPFDYQQAADQPAFQAFLTFWTFLIIFQIMIPLSLYATLEIVKSCQIYFIQVDSQMYYEPTKMKPVCRALNITEDLGQIQHIFSDKTGTLTENKMVFLACSVDDAIYRVPHEDLINDPEAETQMTNDSLLRDAQTTNIISDVINGRPTSLQTERQEQIKEFIQVLSLCNTVVVSAHSHAENGTLPTSESTNSLVDTTLESTPASTPTRSSYLSADEDVPSPTHNGNRHSSPTSKFPQVFFKMTRLAKQRFSHSQVIRAGDEKERKTLESRYEAESPDELALVKAASNMGCQLLARTSEEVKILLPADGGEIAYKVLVVLPFDSVRKCMSVVLRTNDGEIIMYTKGADTSIFPKIKADEANIDLVKQTRIFVNHFAKDGLRTLCMAKKVLSKAEFTDWYARYTDSNFEDREARQFALYNELENDLDLLGSTGIEDKLQEKVPESIKLLREAHIKIWVLTGDKQETAINIGYSCGLLTHEAAIITLNVPNKDEVRSVIQSHLNSLDPDADDEDQAIPRCLVVDGQTLAHIFTEETVVQKPRKRPRTPSLNRSASMLPGGEQKLSRLFLRLANSCVSVLCCRSTPAQKAQIVQLVRDKSKKLVLSIGDGANDVNMIRTANVGVGIAGLEGRQASMAADFSIARFSHLVRLLFVHGHWTYDRLAVMVLYNFFKNSNLIFVLFWFQIYCMFSGQNHIDQIYLIVFHLLFTSLPPIVLGILDRDLPDNVLMENARLYKQGPDGKLYHSWSYWVQILDSLYQSLVVFFIPYFAFRSTDIGLWELGTLHTVTLVFTQLIILLYETRTYHWPYVSSMIITIVFFWFFVLILNYSCLTCDHPSNPFGVAVNILAQPAAWLTIAVTVVVAVIPRLIVKVMVNMFFPTDTIITRTLVHNANRVHSNVTRIEWPGNDDISPTGTAERYGDPEAFTTSTQRNGQSSNYTVSTVFNTDSYVIQ